MYKNTSKKNNIDSMMTHSSPTLRKESPALKDEPGLQAGATHESVYSVASHSTPIHTGDIVSLCR